MIPVNLKAPPGPGPRRFRVIPAADRGRMPCATRAVPSRTLPRARTPGQWGGGSLGASRDVSSRLGLVSHQLFTPVQKHDYTSKPPTISRPYHPVP
jgi:hypothetical protein